MKRTQIYLSDKQFAKLRQVSTEDQINVSELIRRIIDLYFNTGNSGTNNDKQLND